MNPLARKDNLVVQALRDELLVYDLHLNKAICLNKTSAFIWHICDGKKSVREIQAEVEANLGGSVNEDFVLFALDQLSNTEEIATVFEGMGRRELIKKIALGSLVALPIVSSLAAPQAASAASTTCMVVVGGCRCGLAPTVLSGGRCIPGGLFAVACMDSTCQCYDRGFGSYDDCRP